MQALILMGGKGERLKPLTLNTPKPLLPVNGIPMVVYQIEMLKRFGIKDIILSVGYKLKNIIETLGDGKYYGVKFSYAKEFIPLGTGGAIANASRLIHGRCFILNCDILSDFNLNAIYKVMSETKSDVVITTKEVEDPTRFGSIISDNGIVTGFLEKSKLIVSHEINAGCYLFNPGLASKICKEMRFVSLEKTVFPAWIRKGVRIAKYKHGGAWVDVGTLEDYERVNKLSTELCSL